MVFYVFIVCLIRLTFYAFCVRAGLDLPASHLITVLINFWGYLSGHIWLHVRSAGHWTRKLYEYFDRHDVNAAQNADQTAVRRSINICFIFILIINKTFFCEWPFNYSIFYIIYFCDTLLLTQKYKYVFFLLYDT